MNSTQTSEVEWGAEIPVNGVRPEWLASGVPIMRRSSRDRQWYGGNGGLDWTSSESCMMMGGGWLQTDMIRLHANHPHYATLGTTKASAEPVESVSSDVVERMEALVRRMASPDELIVKSDYAEARAIVALLPEPVDGDVLIAREMRLEEVGECGDASYRRYMNEGAYDQNDDVQKFVRAIKRGRALERGEG